jgi:hypothetical protein
VGCDRDDVRRILDALRDVSGPAVVQVGTVPAGSLHHWPERLFDAVFITRRQRAHYLAQHPEMIEFEEDLVWALLDPDEVHTSKRGERTAIFFRSQDATHDIAVVMSISEEPELMNSVITARRQRAKRKTRRDEAGRKVWER